MNILFLDLSKVSPEKGGIARVISSLRTFWEGKGHKTYFLFFEDCENNGALPATVFRFPDERKRRSPANLAYMVDIIRRYDIEYVINNTLPDKDMIRLCARLKKELPGIYLINLMHSVPDYVIRALRLRIENFVVSGEKELKPFLRWMFKDLYLYLIGRILRRRYKTAYTTSDAIVLLSDSYKPVLKKLAGLASEDKLYAIPNPVSSRFDVPVIPAGQKEKQIVYVGRLDKEKGVHRLLLIWDKLYKRLPEWSLWIVGDGPLRQEYEALCRRLGVEQIEFTGFRDPIEYVNRSSVLCLTSDYEGFGLVLAEAMTLGTVPFSFDNFGAVYDIIDNGENGMIIPAWNLDRYAEALYAVAVNDDKRRRMSEQAVVKSRRFSLETVSARWFDLFHKIAGRY